MVKVNVAAAGTFPVVKPQSWAQLKELVSQGLAEGPMVGHGVEESKAYSNLIGGFTVPGAEGQGDAVYAAHPEDAEAFVKHEGQILVWYLKAERKYCVVRSCASGSGEMIVVRTSDLMFKRFASSAKPGGARRGPSRLRGRATVELPTELA